MADHPKPDPHAVTVFLADFPLATQALVHQLRSMMEQAVPGLVEAVYPGWRLLGYRVRHNARSHYFGFIAPFPDRVVLGFEYGSQLSDPHGLLTGTGKHVRQAVLLPGAEPDATMLIPMILEAALLARHRHDHR
jgi:hypothetical protein